MEFGVVLPHNEIGTDPGAMKAWAQGAEALGAHHALIYDHVLGADASQHEGYRGPYDKDVAFHEPLTASAFMAAVTERMIFSSNVMILPQRQAALVAKQAAEVAILSGNRFRLGVGIGWNQVEYEALEIPMRRRGARLEEQVAVMRRLWSEDAFTFEGEFHKVTAAGINPRPSAPIEVWFGGGAPGAIERCARIGNGWIPLMGPNDKAAACVDTLRRVREEAGLPWDGFGIQAQIQTAGGSPERWAGAVEKWRALGATHIAIVTHGAGFTQVDEHLRGIEAFFDCVR